MDELIREIDEAGEVASHDIHIPEAIIFSQEVVDGNFVLCHIGTVKDIFIRPSRIEL